ncbi:testican-2-like [Stylophora pistillata]|uniref:Testican-2 n=1 Tax=Stylophora pistillata TaxID=50429 RepID=A0A2B4RWG8_STYPI|nr:testican-2-like [Stylophora pistillata]PFX21506.1 Testican-2 [Stylophora pistillata]
MKLLWTLALVSFVFFVVEAEKDRFQELKKWAHWNQIKKAVLQERLPTTPDVENCTALPDRLLDWFHVLRAMHVREEQKKRGNFEAQKPGEVIPHLKLREAKMPFPSGFDQNACREPISSVFRLVLDKNHDGVLDESELAVIYDIATEPCIKKFFKNCAKERETFTEAEFCSCFTAVEPPCLHRLRSNLPALLIRGETRVMPGAYTPSCEEDGFYLPRQCRVTDRQGTKECWCVDRHGSKIEGLLDCVDNTEPPKRLS